MNVIDFGSLLTGIGLGLLASVVARVVGAIMEKKDEQRPMARERVAVPPVPTEE